MIVMVWLAAGVAPFRTLTTHALEFEAALLIETVLVPEPLAISTVFVPLEDPKTIFPV